MKNRYIVIRDQSAKTQGGTRNVIYDVEEKRVIFRKKTKHKEDRYWHSRDKAQAVVGMLEAGEIPVVYNARYDFYHLGEGD
jgi:hypothetical protein